MVLIVCFLSSIKSKSGLKKTIEEKNKKWFINGECYYLMGLSGNDCYI